MKKQLKLELGKLKLFEVVIYTLPILIISLIFSYFFFFQQEFIENNFDNFSDSWQKASKEDIRDFELVESVSAMKPDVYVEYLTLNFDNPKDYGCIYFIANHQMIDVVINDEFVTASDISESIYGLSSYTKRIHGQLKEEDNKIVIRVQSKLYNYLSRHDSFFFGTVGNISKYIALDALNTISFASICIVIGLFLICYSLINSKAEARKANIGNIALAVTIILWGIYFMLPSDFSTQLLSPLFISRLSNFIYSIIPTVFALYFYANIKNFKKPVLFIFLLMAIFNAIEFFSFVFLNFEFVQFGLFFDIFYIIFCLFGVSMLLLDIKKGNQYFKRMIPFIILMVISLLVFSVFYYFGEIKIDYRIFNMVSLLFFVYIFIYNLRIINTRAVNYRKEMASIDMKKSMAVEAYEQLETHMEQVNEVKHDMRHHLNALQILLSNHNFDEANEYLNGLSNRVNSISTVTYCNYYVINSVLAYYVKKAEKKQIEFEILINLPEQIYINDDDLFSIISNMLENAIEAVKKINKIPKPVVKFECSEKQNYLFIKCQNMFDGNIQYDEDRIITSKSNRNDHGLGLKSIQNIAEEYNGNMTVNICEDEFIIEVFLLNILK